MGPETIGILLGDDGWRAQFREVIGNGIRRGAGARVDGALAEDIAGDLIAYLLEKGLRKFRGQDADFWGYLWRVSVRYASRWVRRWRRGIGRHLDEAHVLLQIAAGDCGLSGERSILGKLDRIVLEALTPKQRRVVQLRRRGLDYAEIARILGISSVACRIQFCRARKTIRNRWDAA